MTDHELIKQLLIKHAQGSCSPSEKQLLMHLLKESQGDQGMPELPEIQRKMPEAFRVEMEAEASERIFGNIVGTPSARGRYMRPAMKIAASFLLVLLAGLGLRYYHIQSERLIAETTYGELRNIELPDGTRVMLNANTTIRTFQDYAQRKEREVWIDGEAFFSVTHNPDQPFIVHTTRGMDVRVLGTEFNVKSRQEQAQVVLNKGSVEVSLGEKGERIQQRITPGEMIVADPRNLELNKSKVDTLYYASWKYNLLAFRGEPLEEVARVIQDRYGYAVTFGDPKLKSLRFTGSVPSDDLELVLDMIARTFDVRVDKTGNKITITE